MKIHVEQMQNWNSYAYYAEDVDKEHWAFFKDDLWWQIGSSFIKVYDGVQDFEFCAENFSEHGDTIISQQLKITPSPWKKALDWLVSEIKKLNVDWYVHGSVAMALWGLDYVNIIVQNASDFEKVRVHFYRLAFKPFERCENWVMSGLGDIFKEAVIGFSFHNREAAPFDGSGLKKLEYKGEEINVSSLEMLRQDNENFNRPERVRMIECAMGNC